MRQLDVFSITPDDANLLWDRVKDQDICFDDFSRGRDDLFAARLASPQTVAFELDYGLVTVENILPKLSGVIHFFIWSSPPSEAVMLADANIIIDLVFQTYQLKRITAAPPRYNKLAAKLATTLGFQYEGCLKSGFLYKGTYQDILLYGLVR